jgi:Protein of unknown function (DUF2948)
MSEPKSPSSALSSSQSSSAKGGSVKGPAPLPGLRLVALDAVDLTIISANLQDAVGRVRDMAYVPKEKRFALLLNRFDWIKPGLLASGPRPAAFERRRCALRFEHVRAARITGFVQRDKKRVLSLLTIGFEQTREGDPGGRITLLFAGGGAIRLDAECIEAELTDIGAGWRTAVKPEHPES